MVVWLYGSMIIVVSEGRRRHWAREDGIKRAVTRLQVLRAQTKLNVKLLWLQSSIRCAGLVFSYPWYQSQSLSHAMWHGGESMAGEKRKTKTSTEVKRRYNAKTYTVISASVPKELAAAFKEKCAAEGVPQAQVIKQAIQAFLNPWTITLPRILMPARGSWWPAWCLWEGMLNCVRSILRPLGWC